MKASETLVPFVNLLEGLNVRVDEAKAPGLSVMRNVILSDRGGVSTRPGTELFGATGTGSANTSGHVAIRRDGTNIMLRANGTVLEYYNRDTSSWNTLKSGYTSGQIFGFADFNINTDAQDYVYFCNAVEPYQRWSMAYDKTTSTLAGGEATIPIQSTLLPEVYFSGTASSVSATTITMPAGTWATDIWNSGFYVRITSGAAQGEIRDITATSATQITFGSIGTLAGTPTFEIRRLKFSSETPTIVYGSGSTMAVTAITTDTGLTVASAPALASGSAIAESPANLMSNSCPRGNILKTLFQQMYVAGVKSATSTVFRSKLNDASDFTYSATRTPGQGDVVQFPSNGPIYDTEVYEDSLAVFSESSVYQLTYTQDGNDLAQRIPLVSSPYIGTKGRVNRMMNDVAFVNPSNEVTTLSRVPFRDVRPLPSNIAWSIKRLMRNYGTDASRVKTYKNYMLVSVKSTPDSTTNDKIIVYDNVYERWVGEWDLSAADFVTYSTSDSSDLYFNSAASNETYKMLTNRTSQVKGSTVIGYDTEVATNWVNRTSTTLHNQFFNVLTIRGYIKPNTTLNFSLYYDFNEEATHNWSFDPTAVSGDILLGGTGEDILGVEPLGVTPLSMELGSDTSEFGERPFFVAYRVPDTIHTWVKLGWTTSGADTYYDITDIQANFTEYTERISQKRELSIES